jgi:hypothetical protein
MGDCNSILGAVEGHGAMHNERIPGVSEYEPLVQQFNRTKFKCQTNG